MALRGPIVNCLLLVLVCVPHAPQIELFQSRPYYLSPRLPFPFISSPSSSLQTPKSEVPASSQLFPLLPTRCPIRCQVHPAYLFSICLLSLPLQSILSSELQPLLYLTWTVCAIQAELPALGLPDLVHSSHCVPSGYPHISVIVMLLFVNEPVTPLPTGSTQTHPQALKAGHDLATTSPPTSSIPDTGVQSSLPCPHHAIPYFRFPSPCVDSCSLPGTSFLQTQVKPSSLSAAFLHVCTWERTDLFPFSLFLSPAVGLTQTHLFPGPLPPSNHLKRLRYTPWVTDAGAQYMYKEGREGGRGPAKPPVHLWARRKRALTQYGEARPGKGNVSSYWWSSYSLRTCTTQQK